MEARLQNLISLLDDDSQQTANFAIAEILKYDDDLSSILCEYQESDNPNLRKRIHQLESIYTSRQKRKKLAQSMWTTPDDLFQGLMDLHFLWYDSDSSNNIIPYWRALLENSKRYQIDTLEKIAYFMQKYGYRASESREITADFFCLGIVMEELIGASFIICTIAQKLAFVWGMKTSIIKVNDEFCLLDDTGNILNPSRGWSTSTIDETEYTVWSNKQLLQHDLTMLYICAVSTDSFRYINTLGSILTQSLGGSGLAHLPTPYTVK